MTTSRQKTELEEVAECDFLISPDDLLEIMQDLEGEELTLEELAQTLLDGGIELEYLETKYKTNKGYYNLLIVIACQHELEVDWEDLARRCEEVVLMVVGDYIHHDSEALINSATPDTAIADLVSEAERVDPRDPRINQLRYVDFYGHLQWLRRVIAEAPRKPLHRGAIAPKWSDPHLGPITTRGGTLVPGPRLSRDVQTPKGLVSKRTHKSAMDLLETRIFPGIEGPPLSQKGMTPAKYLAVVKEAPDKSGELLSPWSKSYLRTVLQEATPPPATTKSPRDWWDD